MNSNDPRSLPPHIQKAIEDYRKHLKAPGTKLGLLVRRFETCARDLQEGLRLYGQDPATLLGNEIPVRACADVHLSVQVGDASERNIFLRLWAGAYLTPDGAHTRDCEDPHCDRSCRGIGMEALPPHERLDTAPRSLHRPGETDAELEARIEKDMADAVARQAAEPPKDPRGIAKASTQAFA